MARYLGPKAKLCRKFGENIFGNPKYDRILKKRNYPAGMHGPKRSSRKSDYGMHLSAKQKCRYIYEIMEKQFKGYFVKAQKMTGDTGDNFLILLENRLDSVVFNSNLFNSRSEARQIINHGHILINDKKVDIPSYQVSVGDIVSFKLTPKQNNKVEEKLKNFKSEDLKSNLFFDPEKRTLKVLSLPNVDVLKDKIDIRLIVEYYSK
jgi:small subunit ribosomal protein S4